jgi:hypothetical protein
MQNCGGSILETIENQNKIIRIQNQTIDRLAIVAMQHGEIDDESLREIEQTSRLQEDAGIASETMGTIREENGKDETDRRNNRGD